MNAIILLVAVAAIGLYVYRRARSADSSLTAEPDMQILEVRHDPPSGSTLKVNTPIVTTIKYRYSRPNGRFFAWTKILTAGAHSMYEASSSELTPGTGEVTRYAYLTEPGKVTELHFVVRNARSSQPYSYPIPVDFTYEAVDFTDEELTDGLGSQVVGVEFDVQFPAVVKVGTLIRARIKYAVNSKKGLNMWVLPNTDRHMVYFPSEQTLSGDGSIDKQFSVNEPCRLESITINMNNSVNREVYRTVIPVDIKFVG